MRSGERIPIDAEIMEGNPHIDESLITGEGVSVAKIEELNYVARNC